MGRLVPFIVTSVAAALAFAACGSSASEESRDAFIARADALCGASKARQAPLRARLEAVTRKARTEEGEGALTDATRAALAHTLTRIVVMAEASQARIQALRAPEADAGELAAIFAKTEAAFEASRAYGAALVRHEDAAAQAIAEKGNAQTSATAALAARYGFEVCGSRP